MTLAFGMTANRTSAYPSTDAAMAAGGLFSRAADSF
jgi:hypothetical protein